MDPESTRLAHTLRALRTCTYTQLHAVLDTQPQSPQASSHDYICSRVDSVLVPLVESQYFGRLGDAVEVDQHRGTVALVACAALPGSRAVSGLEPPSSTSKVDNDQEVSKATTTSTSTSTITTMISSSEAAARHREAVQRCLATARAWEARVDTVVADTSLGQSS